MKVLGILLLVVGLVAAIAGIAGLGQPTGDARDEHRDRRRPESAGPRTGNVDDASGHRGTDDCRRRARSSASGWATSGTRRSFRPIRRKRKRRQRREARHRKSRCPAIARPVADAQVAIANCDTDLNGCLTKLPPPDVSFHCCEVPTSC